MSHREIPFVEFIFNLPVYCFAMQYTYTITHGWMLILNLKFNIRFKFTICINMFSEFSGRDRKTLDIHFTLQVISKCFSYQVLGFVFVQKIYFCLQFNFLFLFCLKRLVSGRTKRFENIYKAHARFYIKFEIRLFKIQVRDSEQGNA